MSITRQTHLEDHWRGLAAVLATGVAPYAFRAEYREGSRK